MNADIAVQCRSVMKTYGAGESKVTALQGVDLDVYTGELLMLVGPSGSGKTTLISVIAGILDHDEGRCLLYGRDHLAMAERDRTVYRGKHIGFVFQSFNLIPTLTLADNVSIPLLISGVDNRTASERAMKCLSDVGLAGREQAMPWQISGGQQQRVAVARALVHNPRLVVCDEPTSTLDHATGLRVMELLKRVAVDGSRSLIIVTHDARIFEFADRIAYMEDGRIERIENRKTRGDSC
jgi:putative ABC transport system ATP-binding protein